MSAQSIKPNQKPTCDLKSASSSVREQRAALRRRAVRRSRCDLDPSVGPRLCVCLIIINLLCQKLPLSPLHHLWSLDDVQQPSQSCYEYACLCFGIYSFNGLERDVISHIFPLPCFGRYFEVFACLCVCVCVPVANLAGVSSVWETAK